MKTLLKLLLPTLIPFVIFARYTALDEAHKHISGQLTEISLNSLMYYFRYSAPVLCVILLLTQYVIIIPIWNSLNAKLWKAVVFTLIWVLLATALLSAGVSYVVWDQSLGSSTLNSSIKTLFAIQALYWLVNIIILLIIDVIAGQLAAARAKKEI